MTTRQRFIVALGAGMVLAALPVALPGPGITAGVAYAQQPDRATRAMFLAVDKNDLPGVQATIDGGADINARDYNGMQAVDLAIERGYFDIAHYLISVRNQLEAQGGPAKPTPSLEQLAQVKQAQQAQQAPAAAPTPPPAPTLPPGTPNPFDAPRADDGLPVIGGVVKPDQAPAQREMAQAQPPAPAPAPAQAKSLADAEAPPTKPSATRSFFTTFTNFFKPPNTTGIVRKDTRVGEGGQDALTDAELAEQLHQIEAERGDAPIRGPAVPMSPDELARELPPAPVLPDEMAGLDNGGFETPELPPYRVAPPGAPEVSSEEAFGGLEIDEVTAADDQALTGSTPIGAIEAPLGKPFDPSLPFGGGVDPDILALLGMGPDSTPASAASDDPFADAASDLDPFADAASDEDPFATPAQTGDDSVAGLLDGLDDADDPFATAPEGEVDELAGLLEGVGESVASKPDGWDVKDVEGAALPGEMPVLIDIEPTGQALDGVELALGADTVIGQAVGDDRLKMMDEETIHKPCLQKGGPETVYCVDKVSWPFELEEDFLVDTIMYQGTRTITRYDAGRASYFHALFNTGAFTKVVNYYIGRFGQPTEVVDRAIAPLAQPRRDNPTYIWRTREPGTDTITTLEIRQFDDARGGFPDTKRGVTLLYRAHAGGIFPQLSQLELMVLKDSGTLDLTPKTPDSVW